MDLGADPDPWFDGFSWVRFTGAHWEVPLTAVTVYFILIPLLRWMVAKHGKWNVRDFAFYWNAGFFVMLFIYSKVAELLDTVLLLLAKKPVIALQWWHHSTVLLYCWHAYSNVIATGIWFAAMNYSVHAVMYGYFAITATKCRKCVTPYATCMCATIKAVFHQTRGEECHVNKTNSVLGLVMYFSYFVLFFKLFVDNYYCKSKDSASLPRKPSVALDIARKASEKALDDMCANVDENETAKKTQ